MLHAARWWTLPPAHEVSVLTGAAADLLALSLDPLPDDAPAVVQYRPTACINDLDYVDVLLTELDRAALGLFPQWLPGAEGLDGGHRLGVAAARVLAGRLAAASSHFGPFLADLAERGLKAQAGHTEALPAARLPAEVRAAGLVKVIAAAYRRPSATVLVHVPPGSSRDQQHEIVRSAEWLAFHGRLGVWLAGLADHFDHVRAVPIDLPSSLRDLAADVVSPAEGIADSGTVSSLVAYPPLSGMPRWDSPAELALEKALARHDWSSGRHWNYTHLHAVLAKPYRLDIFWPHEGLVVEVDGDDHRSRLKYAEDRRRDVRLQLLGFDVLRFTNEQVLTDIAIVVHEIKHILSWRRMNAAGRTEERHHAQR